MTSPIAPYCGRVGLAVADMQTFHRGHNNLLNEMRMSCDRAIVGLGSIRRHSSPGHPFTFEQRCHMIRAIHGDFFGFVALDDIDAGRDIRDWYAYVSSKIAKAGLPEPTDYFGGSRIDAKWYFHAFADVSDPHVMHGSTTVHVNRDTGKRLHIVDREALGLPSGREVRLLIETRDPEWKRYVPERLHDWIEAYYPPHLRQPIRYDDVALGQPATLGLALSLDRVEEAMAAIGTFPTGTRVTGSSRGLPSGNWDDAITPDGKSVLLELKDDGRWRPLRQDDEKANWALARGIGSTSP